MVKELLNKLNTIKTEKDAKIIPENIKSGVEIFGVTGTYGGDTKLNLYVQEDEPSSKDGIWLKTNKEYEEVITDKSTTMEPYWNIEKMNSLQSIPADFYNSDHGSPYGASMIGTDIYLFGGFSDDYILAYKYDTLTDTYTQLSNIPYSCNGLGIGTIGTNIYLFGGFTNPNIAYKYDTLTDTYTQLSNIPYDFFSGGLGVVGTNIYLFGGGNYQGSTSQIAYKYDTLTDTYTQLTAIPYKYRGGGLGVVGTNIYLFGGNHNTHNYEYTYKYDTITDTYTQLSNIPYEYYGNSGNSTVVGTDIYVFSNWTDNDRLTTKWVYKYDTIIDTYTKLSDRPLTSVGAVPSAIIGNDIYIFGGYSNLDRIQIFTFPQKDYTNNSVIIETKPTTYTTELMTTNVVNGVPFSFNDVFYYTTEEGLDNTISTYYGDGTTWIKFKN